MNTELIFCPSCNHKLRVPSDLMGQRVQCPKCGTEFTAPPPRARADDDWNAAAPPPPPDDAYAPRPRREDDWDEPPRRTPQRAGRGVVIAPGVAVIVMGVFALLSSVFTLVQIVADPAGFRQQMQQIKAMMPGGGGPQPFDPLQVAKIVSGVFIVISLLQILGGGCMAARRAYPMAIIGAILAIINCNNVLICIPNFAVGIWAMIVLMLPGVRAHFTRPA
jgi:hypothetical protein